MANEQNLIPFSERTEKEARELGKLGGIRSGEVRRERKTLKEELLSLLAEGDIQKRLSLAQLEKALKGDTKAYEVIRDTIGEKPTDKVENSGTQSMVITVQGDAAAWGK